MTLLEITLIVALAVVLSSLFSPEPGERPLPKRLARYYWQIGPYRVFQHPQGVQVLDSRDRGLVGVFPTLEEAESALRRLPRKRVSVDKPSALRQVKANSAACAEERR